jgi:hypothetical protein
VSTSHVITYVYVVVVDSTAAGSDKSLLAQAVSSSLQFKCEQCTVVVST